jgi:hypothetical protein
MGPAGTGTPRKTPAEEYGGFASNMVSDSLTVAL